MNNIENIPALSFQILLVKINTDKQIRIVIKLGKDLNINRYGIPREFKTAKSV